MGHEGHITSNRANAARTVLALCATALFCLAFVSQAFAGGPFHPRLAAQDITGLNHACGTAVDNKGDLYASSAGESKVKVFNEAHTELTSIANANEPCGLAVDSKGNLYVSEAKTGHVVKYHPSAYPFVGTPTYEAPVTIDASGSAKGISVDSTDDSLYVAEGTRVTLFKSDGTLFTGNEVQGLSFSGSPSAGTYKLSFKGSETAPIAYNATSEEVQAALEALPTIGSGNVTVVGNSNKSIAFTGSLATTNVPQLGVDASALVGGSAAIEPRLDGFNGHFGEGELTKATGVVAYTSHASENFKKRRYISVADVGADQIKVFIGRLSNTSGFEPGTLEPRATIDGSETPEGELGLASTGAYLGLDEATGHLFAYDATHKVVNEFEATGQYFGRIEDPAFEDAEPTDLAVFPQSTEVQKISTGATGGSFTLSFEGTATSPLPYNATSAEVQGALEAVIAIGPGNVMVGGGYSGSSQGGTYTIAFTKELGNHNVPPLECNGSALTGPVFCTVKTESQGSGPGRVYVTAGASTGSKVLSFGPVTAPGRAELPALSHEFIGVCGTAVDSQGDLYVAGNAKIMIYDPAGNELGSISDSQHPCQLAVDSEGNLYAVELGRLTVEGDEKASLYEPSSYPFSGPPSYAAPKKLEEGLYPEGLAVNPANDHLFVTHTEGHGVREYDSAKNGSGLLKSAFCGLGNTGGIDVYGATGEVYVISESDRAVDVCNPAGTKLLTKIDGSGGPEGAFSGLNFIQIAVDQSNGHVFVGEMLGRGAVEEYEASGAFVARFGSFGEGGHSLTDVAVDNSCALHEPPLAGAACESFDPANGNLYAAYDDPSPENPYDLTAFGPLNYGEPPVALTSRASGVGGTDATLNGTVDPNGFDVGECRFEYLKDSEYEANIEQAESEGHEDATEEGYGFEGATTQACTESAVEIGAGEEPVPVHVDLTGLEAEGRYRFRLIAENEFGICNECREESGLFGPPVLAEKSAQPILYREATLRGEVDPSGLETEYHFEYGPTEAYGHSTPVKALPPSDGGSFPVQAPLVGLEEGVTYHFRLLVANEDASKEGEDQTFTTQQRHPALSCPNQTLRLENNSSHLPDCRAYELVTPADTVGIPQAEEAAALNNWLVVPSGPAAGESLTFFLRNNTLPGTEGNGGREGFRASRGAGGWSSAGISPTYVQKGAHLPGFNRDIAPDQLYSVWEFGDVEPPGAFPFGSYLRTAGTPNPSCVPAGIETPGHFETAGCGTLGEDLKAVPDYVSAGGAHVIFSSTEHLEEGAAPKGTQVIYDRAAGSASARVVSLKPDGSSFDTGEGATFQGVSEDGSAVVFSVGGDLYLHREGTGTIKVANGPASFAGVSEDGERVFYTDNASGPKTAGLWVCEIEAGPCPANSVQIAASGKFVNVSPDGSHAYFVTGVDLEVWNGVGTKLVAVLSPSDLEGSGPTPFPGTSETSELGVDAWTGDCAGRPRAAIGRANCPSRGTPDGRFLVFQSHADLTPPYESDGHSEIFRYDAIGESLTCVSCDPSGTPATAEADLQAFPYPSPTSTVMATSLIPGITEDGSGVFFQTASALLPEDANAVLDVYEWQAQGASGCVRAGGCLALISSGQGDSPSTIYAETRDGHDVFFSTLEKLNGSDTPASPSIYDARVGGGFPQPVAKEPCHGDACQGEGSAAPTRPSVRSDVSNSGNVEEPAPCRKGKHRVRGRCVASQHHHHRRRRHHRANHKRRASR